MNKPAAIYARVSSDRQKENHTIASQTAALIEYAQMHGYSVPPEWVFQDEGYSGAILVRPGLEALRDLAAEGQIAAVLIYSPDRLSRKYAYQVLLSEELSRCGVELIFLKAPVGATPEDQLLVQFQGMIFGAHDKLTTSARIELPWQETGMGTEEGRSSSAPTGALVRSTVEVRRYHPRRRRARRVW